MRLQLDKSAHRWTDRMETEGLGFEHRRKGSQWFALTRAHAQLVVDDSTINDVFQTFCFPEQDNTMEGE